MWKEVIERAAEEEEEREKIRFGGGAEERNGFWKRKDGRRGVDD